jgi:hypothetical protein
MIPKKVETRELVSSIHELYKLVESHLHKNVPPPYSRKVTGENSVRGKNQVSKRVLFNTAEKNVLSQTWFSVLNLFSAITPQFLKYMIKGTPFQTTEYSTIVNLVEESLNKMTNETGTIEIWLGRDLEKKVFGI